LQERQKMDMDKSQKVYNEEIIKQSQVETNKQNSPKLLLNLIDINQKSSKFIL